MSHFVTINHAVKCDAESVRARLTELGIELPVIAVPAGDSNWDLWIGVAGFCAAVPTERTKAQGCKMSSFGDPNYLRGYIAREGAKMANRVDPVILGALGLAVIPGKCEAFALCDHPATQTIPHPILGPVHSCARCADKLEGDS